MELTTDTCFICGSPVKVHFQARGETLVKCDTCTFVHVKDKPSDEKLDAIYGEAYFSHSKYRDLDTLKAEEMKRLELLKKHVAPSPQTRVLDAGCANGDFIAVAKGAYSMYGNDYSAHAIDNARRLNPELADHLTAGPIEQQSYGENYFDAIVLWDVIEHLWSPKEVAEQLLRYLKPGGYLLISTPNIGAPFARLTGKYWPFMTPPEHLSFFTRKSFKYMFEEELHATVKEWGTRGKRANVGFVFYKIKRIFPRLVPSALIRLFGRRPFNKWSVYVPTGDIQYLAVQKRSVY